MPITNLNNEHFSAEKKTEILDAWKIILNVLNEFTRNLTAEERGKFGSINEENKLVVQKVLEYHRNQSHLSSPDVNYKELQADWEDRQFLAGFMSMMLEATTIVNNIRITHDYDAFNSAMTDYRYTKYKIGTEPGAGFEQKYKDLRYFFKNTPAHDDSENDSDNK